MNNSIGSDSKSDSPSSVARWERWTASLAASEAAMISAEMSKRYHLVCHEIAKKFGGAQDMFGFYHRSVYGNIMTAARSRMQHARADKLVYCHA